MAYYKLKTEKKVACFIKWYNIRQLIDEIAEIGHCMADYSDRDIGIWKLWAVQPPNRLQMIHEQGT